MVRCPVILDTFLSLIQKIFIIMKKQSILILFIVYLLLFALQSIAQPNKDSDTLTIKKRYLFFFTKTLEINQSSPLFDILKNKIEAIAYNSYARRKTFFPNNKGNDISCSNNINLKLSKPIKIPLLSFEEELPILVNEIRLPFYESNINIPIVLNNQIPVFSEYEKYEDFMNDIKQLLNKGERHGE